MSIPDNEVIAFLRGRSAACPRCNYELRDLDRPQCPECGEPLVLKVGSPNVHFGWLLLAAAPGCFCIVASVLMFLPVLRTVQAGGGGVPWSIMFAWVFGVVSSASVYILYRQRKRFLARSARAQIILAVSVWATHILVFVLMIGALIAFPRTPTPAPTPAATSAPAPPP